MTKKTKELIKCLLKLLKCLLKLLFLPITGFHYLIKECKNDDYQNFFTEWFCYLLMLIMWCGSIAIIGIGIWSLIYHFDTAILPVSIIGGGIFVLFILPVIIHKLIHKK